MSKYIKYLTRLIMSGLSLTIFIIGVILYVHWKQVSVSKLFILPKKIMLVAVLLYIVQVLAHTKLAQSFFEQKKITFKDLIGINLFALLLNFFVSKAGTIAFIAVLKIQYNLKVKEIIKILVIATIYTAVFFGIVGVSIFTFFLIKSPVTIAALFVCLCISGWMWPRRKGYKIIKRSVYLGIILVTTGLRMMLLFSYLDSPITIPAAGAITAFYNLAPIVSMTPATVGFREAFMYAAAFVVNEGKDVIVEVNIIDRIITLIVLIPAGIWYFVANKGFIKYKTT